MSFRKVKMDLRSRRSTISLRVIETVEVAVVVVVVVVEEEVVKVKMSAEEAALQPLPPSPHLISTYLCVATPQW